MEDSKLPDRVVAPDFASDADCGSYIYDIDLVGQDWLRIANG